MIERMLSEMLSIPSKDGQKSPQICHLTYFLKLKRDPFAKERKFSKF